MMEIKLNKPIRITENGQVVPRFVTWDGIVTYDLQMFFDEKNPVVFNTERKQAPVLEFKKDAHIGARTKISFVP